MNAVRLVRNFAVLLAPLLASGCGTADRVAGGASSETENAVQARMFLVHPDSSVGADSLWFRYRSRPADTSTIQLLSGANEYQVRTPAGAVDFALRRTTDSVWLVLPSPLAWRDTVLDVRLSTDSVSGALVTDLRIFADCPEGRDCGLVRDTRDGRTYSWVDLAGTRWLRQNASYGSGLPGVYAGTGDLAAFDAQGRILHGLHYTWDAASGLACPDGWRLATRADWNNLEAVITQHHAERIRAVGAWRGAFPGTDATTLGIRPSGWREADGAWSGGGADGRAHYWTSETLTDSTAMDRWFVGTDSLFHDDIRAKSLALSVRCTQS